MARRRSLTHADIIRLWPKPSIRTFAADIGVKLNSARKMEQRASISDAYWEAVEAAAKRRRIKTADGESVTVRLLAGIRAARRPPAGNFKSPLEAAE